MARVDYTRTPPLYVFLRKMAGVTDSAYLPRGRRFESVLPTELRVGALSHPTMLYDDMETLPLAQLTPPHVENRYVHVALCHDPREAYPDYLKALDPFYLGAAHAALLGYPSELLPDHDRVILEYMRWTNQIGVYVWMWDPSVPTPRKPPGDPKYLPGTPWDDLRYHNAHAATTTITQALASLGIDPDVIKNREKWLDALEELVYAKHVPRTHGDYFLTSVRDLPLKTPSFLAPSTRNAPSPRRKRRKRKRRRKRSKKR